MIDIYVEEFERKMEDLSSKKESSSDDSDSEEKDSEEKPPISEIMKPFENLAQNSVSKVVKKRVYEEVLDLPHLEKNWGYRKSIDAKPSNLDDKGRMKKKAKTK